jgi:hypothetical protein
MRAGDASGEEAAAEIGRQFVSIDKARMHAPTGNRAADEIHRF